MTPMTQNWLAAFFTISIYSLVLYKDNKLFRLSETVMVAVTAANGIVLTYHNYIKPTVAVDIIRDHKYWRLIPLLIGLLMYARFFRPVAWVSRIPMGFWLGVGAGYIFTKTPGVFLSQILATFLSLNTVNNIIFVAGVLAVTVYFYFTVPNNREPMKSVSQAGRLFLLVSFGAAFANTVMSRVSLLLGRLQFLLQDFLRLS